MSLRLAVLAGIVLVGAALAAPLPKPKDPSKPLEGVPVEAVEGEAPRLTELRRMSSNNLKQLGLALHNYHDVNGHLPQDIADKDGKPLLSWRVHLLPYLEQDNLYKQFKLDEAWDGPTNKALLEKMPKTLASPRVTVKAAGHTVYQGFSGPGTPFEKGTKPLGFADVADGMSNTIFAIESSVAVPWTKPIDLPFEPKTDLPVLGKGYAGIPLVALMDGSVRPIDLSKVAAETLKAAITRAGGETISLGR